VLLCVNKKIGEGKLLIGVLVNMLCFALFFVLLC